MLGFAFSWVCSDLWFLAQLFVSRGDRSGYVDQWAFSGGHGWTNARKFVRGFLAGLLLLVSSLSIVRVHNVWAVDWRIITLAGWFSVFGGLVRMLMPEQSAAVAMPVVGNRAGTMTSGALFLLLGVYLSLKGYQLIG